MPGKVFDIMLHFANNDKALQYLADLTGKRIVVASKNLTKMVMRKIAFPAGFKEDFDDHRAVLDMTDKTKKLFEKIPDDHCVKQVWEEPLDSWWLNKDTRVIATVEFSMIIDRKFIEVDLNVSLKNIMHTGEATVATQYNRFDITKPTLFENIQNYVNDNISYLLEFSENIHNWEEAEC